MITVRLPVFAALGARPWHNGSTAPSGMSAFLGRLSQNVHEYGIDEKHQFGESALHHIRVIERVKLRRRIGAHPFVHR